MAAANLNPVDTVIDRLRDAGCNPKASRPGQWNAKCPNQAGHTNGDKNPSLSIGTGPDGKALVHCQTGCKLPDVAQALRLEVHDLFPDKPHATIGQGKRIVSTYDYYDADGTFVFQVVRYRPKTFRQRQRDGRGEWAYSLAGVNERPLYMLPQVRRAIANGQPIWMTEGEKDAESLQWAVDGAVTCNSGGAEKWRDEYADQLAGARRITLVQDNDAPGLRHVKVFAAKLLLAGFADITVIAPPAPFKDAAEALGAGRTIDQFVHVWDNSETMSWLTVDEPDDDDDVPDDSDDDGDVVADDDWQPIDLDGIARQIIDGTYQPTTPTVLEVSHGIPLFYAERINSLFGESGGGKTWVALRAVAEQVALGRRVLFIDYEDNPNGIAERLVLLGLTLEQIRLVDYRNPTSAMSYGVTAMDGSAHVYSLVVIDSTGEAMAAGGINSNDDGEVAQWFAIVKKVLRLPGRPAVVVLDHVPKNQEGTTLYGIGSQRKRAAITGASYRVDTIKEPAKGKEGKLKLTVAKDRPGTRAKGTTACHVEIKSTDASIDIECVHEERGDTFRPTVYMERVSRWLEGNQGATQRDVATCVTGKQEVIKTALGVLVSEGYVTITPGARGAQIHTSVRRFRESEDVSTPVDNSAAHRVPTASPPSPGRGQTHDSDLHTASHPLGGTRGRGGIDGKTAPEGAVDNSDRVPADVEVDW